jgi:hypothetical protein
MIKEKNVLLLDVEDAKAKHRRNIVLAICVIATILTAGLVVPLLIKEIRREMNIRRVNKQFPELPYHKCVQMAGQFSEALKDKKNLPQDRAFTEYQGQKYYFPMLFNFKIPTKDYWTYRWQQDAEKKYDKDNNLKVVDINYGTSKSPYPALECLTLEEEAEAAKQAVLKQKVM